MVAVTNFGRGHNYPVKFVQDIKDIARQRQSDVNERQRLKKPFSPTEHQHPAGAFIAQMIAREDGVFSSLGALSAVETMMGMHSALVSDQAHAEGANAGAASARPAHVSAFLAQRNLGSAPSNLIAGGSELLPGQVEEPGAAPAGDVNNSAQPGKGTRALAAHTPAVLAEGNKIIAPDAHVAGNLAPTDGTLGEAADARLLADLLSSAAAGATIPANNHAAEVRAGQPAVDRPANHGHEATMPQPNQAANTDRTLIYAFSSVPGHHHVQVSAGQNITLLPSSQEVIKQMATHPMPENYQLLPVRDEQHGQQPNQDPEQEEDE
ncbi:hypothetical protein [Sodalis sp. C49]|uniref:SpaN/EivJ family type III secretion system needle length determinant n=1 Tax=Sodalis sp. C49 TaxID=3228929 RepID=UPI003965B3CE